MGIARIIIDIAVRAGDAAGEIDRTASSMDKFKQGMGQLAGPAAAAAGAIGGIALTAIKFASDAQQATGGVNAVFKENAQVIQDWAKTSAQSVGMAGAEYKTTAAGIGGALTGMGVSTADAAQQTDQLIKRGADLASVFGGSALDATSAMTSAFRGEYDGLQRLIPSISDAAIKQEMAAEAAAGQTFASEEAAKASAIYNTIMNKSADAAGNFAKESDTAEGAQQRAQAQFKDTAAALGEQLLPAVTQVMQWLSAFGQWISEHIPLVTTLGVVIGGLAVAVLAINAAMAVAAAAQSAAAIATGLWSAAAGLGTVATTAFGVAMAILTSPITLIVLAIAALIAIIVLLVKNWDTVSAAAVKCWDVIKSAAGAALDWIKSTVSSVVDWLKSAWAAFGQAVSAIWDGIKAAAKVAWEFVKTMILAPIIVLQMAWAAFGDDIIAIWNHIKSVATGIWGAIQSAASSALNFIKSIIDGIKRAIDAVISGIKSALSFASSLMSKIPFIGGLFGSSASSASVQSAAPTGARYWTTAGAGTPSLRSRGLLTAAPRVTTRATSAAGGGVTVNVHGALDPVAVARQIERLLTQQRRRSAGMAI